MGLGQACALLPGISRSGATIAVARWSGIEAGESAEMSFLMVVPLLVGAVLLKTPALLGGQSAFGAGPLLLGMVLAAATGYVALVVLVRALSGRHFHWFGVYCLGAGSAALAFLALRG